jgi:hypothetical protein
MNVNAVGGHSLLARVDFLCPDHMLAQHSTADVAGIISPATGSSIS